MARFTRVLTSKEFVELKPYIKYLHQEYRGDFAEFTATFEKLVQRRLINRTPIVRLIANGYMADKKVLNLPKCLIV